MREKLVIIIGPSGVGKSTFLIRALKDFPKLRDAITCTTRKMRADEQEGNPYHFLTRERFEQLLKDDFFIEHAEVHGQLYGTPYEELEMAWSRGQTVIMDLDVQGARTFVGKYPKALTIFIHPPNINMLRQRLIKRHGRAPDDLDLRLRAAEEEIKASIEFSYQLVNDDFEAAYGEFKKLIEDYLRNG